MKCDGCGREIAVGQHAMRVAVTFTTEMPADYTPVSELDGMQLDARFDSPDCFLLWASRQPEVLNVFTQ